MLRRCYSRKRPDMAQALAGLTAKYLAGEVMSCVAFKADIFLEGLEAVRSRLAAYKEVSDDVSELLGRLQMLGRVLVSPFHAHHSVFEVARHVRR